MAKFRRKSTNFDGNVVGTGSNKQMTIKIDFEFQYEGDPTKYLKENGDIDFQKILHPFVKVLNEAEFVEDK
ncbi:hypothetical protein [Sphingobacterium haloxyli]|uniref:Uncharacterized protein n=1 Tax=Sphingobacterium haloxyli TaxID=2100533 RepID=A0A2S9IZY8_9SPHI|nr:hypothetical protein [Sphingobacterium haloxyli]PRD46097.1 hypothetical protein C5745_16870 [Sphingobacterium haloxyli]